jgi:hypothetical protein
MFGELFNNSCEDKNESEELNGIDKEIYNLFQTLSKKEKRTIS